jgi:hypothetical protein
MERMCSIVISAQQGSGSIIYSAAIFRSSVTADDLLVGHRSTSTSSSTLRGRSDESWPWLNSRPSNPRVHNKVPPFPFEAGFLFGPMEHFLNFLFFSLGQ